MGRYIELCFDFNIKRHKVEKHFRVILHKIIQVLRNIDLWDYSGFVVVVRNIEHEREKYMGMRGIYTLRLYLFIHMF